MSQNPPVRVSLASPFDSRDNVIHGAAFNKDAQLINCIAEFEPSKKIFKIKKRPGVGKTWPVPPLVTGGPTGMFAAGNSVFFFAGGNIQTQVYSQPVAGSTPYQLTSTPGNVVGFFMKNTTNAYAWIFNPIPPPAFTFGPITSNYPASTVPGFAFLDGTMYVMDANGQIWGSNLNDATTWNTTNKIVAQNEPDYGVAIAKHLVYVLAFKQWTTEVFYDQGNPTGSPLGPVPEALMSYGCANPYTIQDFGGTKFLLAQTKNMEPQVVRIDGLTPTVVSTPDVERYLPYFIPVKFPSGNQTTTFSFVLKTGGHRFYGLTNTVFNLTLVYDIDQQFWYRWTDANGNYFPFTGGGYVWDNGAGTAYEVLQNIVTGALTRFDADYVQPTDNGVTFSADIYTERMDMQVDRNKMLSALHVSADIGDMTALVRYSDDDYQTWSQPRYIDLSNTRPYLDAFGSFYSRAFHFRVRSETPLRISSMDLQLDLGPL